VTRIISASNNVSDNLKCNGHASCTLTTIQRNRWDVLRSKIFEDDEANSGLDTKEVLGFGFTLCYMLKNFLNVILLLTNENLTNYGTKRLLNNQDTNRFRKNFEKAKMKMRLTDAYTSIQKRLREKVQLPGQ